MVVDIAVDPIFPLSARLQDALFGPHHNSQMLGWIIVGTRKSSSRLFLVLAVLLAFNGSVVVKNR
jgi:hypothetical protein